MKNKFYQLVGSIILAMLCVNTTIHAEDTIDISIDTDTNRITVSGRLEQCKNKAVTILQMRPGVGQGDLENVNDTNAMQYINHTDITITDVDGNYSFSYINHDADDDYTVRIISADRKNVVEKVYSFYGDTLSGLKNDINQAKREKNLQKMQELLSDAYQAINTENEIFESAFANTSIKNTYTELMSEVLIQLPTLEKISELITQFESASMIARMNVFKNESDFNGFIGKYADVLGIKASTAFKTYSESGVKNKINLSMMAKSGELYYNSTEEFRKAFEKETILVSVKNANGWGSVREVLKTNQDLICDNNGTVINLNKCETLNGYEKVYKALEGKKFSSLQELKTEFDRLVKEQANASASNGGGGGGGGGGSHSGGGGSNYVPLADVPERNPQNSSVSQGNGFSDIAGYTWAEASINRLTAENIIVGTGANAFEPGRDVTRSEFVKMLVLAMNLFSPDASVAFSDIGENDWQYHYVSSAYNAGIIALDESRVFRANQTLSREEMATMCYRALKNFGMILGEESAGTGFLDEDMISEYARIPVAELKKLGVVNGMTEITFSPKTNVNRAQAAVIIDKLRNVTGGVQ